MPTVKRAEAYRLFFYASDRAEPEHIHVERDNRVAKFWLSPVRLERSGGFGKSELRTIHIVVEKYQAELLEAWRDYFKG